MAKNTLAYLATAVSDEEKKSFVTLTHPGTNLLRKNLKKVAMPNKDQDPMTQDFARSKFKLFCLVEIYTFEVQAPVLVSAKLSRLSKDIIRLGYHTRPYSKCRFTALLGNVRQGYENCSRTNALAY